MKSHLHHPDKRLTNDNLTTSTTASPSVLLVIEAAKTLFTGLIAFIKETVVSKGSKNLSRSILR
jgi:hypothetical protein